VKIIKTYFWISLIYLISYIQLSAQTITEIKGVSFTVSNLNEALKFYTEVLSFRIDTVYVLQGKKVQHLFGLEDANLLINVARLYLGDEYIELMEFHSKKTISRKIPIDSRSNDLWFQHIAIVVSDMNKAYAILTENEVTHVSPFPQTLPEYLPSAAGITAFYFRDLDGHNLELIYFPAGKGNPKWQNNNQSLFLGIDHTAIGIESTKPSLEFYTNKLGLAIVGVSQNYGTEQEYLNQVFGARLNITGLKANNGIGLEFLDYVSPPGGRPYPTDTKPTDLWYWQTNMKTTNLNKILKHISTSCSKQLSTGGISLKENKLNINNGIIMRDPDGHALFIHD